MTAVALLGNYRSALRNSKANEPGGEKKIPQVLCHVIRSKWIRIKVF